MTETHVTKLYDGTVDLVFYPNSHQYKVDGKRLPSVTGIIGIYDKPALLNWAVNQCVAYLKPYKDQPVTAEILAAMPKEWRKVRDEAAQIGTDFHAFAEAFAKGEKPKLPDGPARFAADAFMQWVTEHHFKPVAIERRILSRQEWYAGTVDVIAEIDGELTVLDYKTSKKPFKGIMYDEWRLQLAAYALAFEEETGMRPTRRIIARFPKEEDDSFEPYEATDHQFDDEGWRATLAAFRWKKGIKREAA